MSGKASQAEAVGWATPDAAHSPGGGGAGWPLVGVGRSTLLPPAASGGAGGSAVAQAEALPGALGLPPLCASVGPSWLQLALPNVRLPQSGFSNNCLEVLSLRGLSQVPRCGGQACQSRESWAQRLRLGLGPATCQLTDARPQLPPP